MIIEDLYQETEYCMRFTNEEILKYFIEPLRMNSDVNIMILSKVIERFKRMRGYN